MKIDILYQDTDYLILNKDSNQLVIPSRNPNEENIRDYLSGRFGKIWVVHRLDRNTSGVLCFAKNEKAHQHLSNLFSENKVTKIYHAICDRTPIPTSGIIDIGIRESQVQKGKMVAHENGKKSITKYSLLESFKNAALLEIHLLTGRTHQIRVHLKFISCPLLVDDMYGHQDKFYLSSIKIRKYKISKHGIEQPLLTRQSLHATQISFINLESKPISVKAPYKKDFKAVLNQLGKWDK